MLSRQRRWKLCIHPGQVDAVNAAFEPTEAEVCWARDVLITLGKARGGVAMLAGRMIDRPHLERARRILAGVENRAR